MTKMNTNVLSQDVALALLIFCELLYSCSDRKQAAIFNCIFNIYQ